MSKTPPEKVAIVVQMRKDKKFVKDIEKATGLNQTTISKICRENGVGYSKNGSGRRSKLKSRFGNFRLPGSPV